jgi:type II secretory pathway pseudopilin PulG
MKASPNLPLSNQGMTLIEVTLVVTTLISLISATMIGTHAYKQGSNRAHCILLAARAQQAIRTFSNLHEYTPGSEVPGLKSRLVGPDKLIRKEPQCPSGGFFLFGNKSLGETSKKPEVIPQIGTVYLHCSLDYHTPSDTTGW